MTKQILLLLSLSGSILLPLSPTTHHLLPQRQVTVTDSPTVEVFKPPNRGHPRITQGSATR